MQGFIFGQGTQAPDAQTLVRKRQVADQLLEQSTARAPRTFGEGLTAIGQALAGRISDRRLVEKEQAERERIAQSLAGLTGGVGGPSASTSGSMSPQQSAMTAHGGPTVGAADEMAIRQGLIARGLPEHVADGFIKNFRDESGLRTDINEIAPLVPGSRGGFGLSQWTGPRRRELEAFAAQRGAPVSDLDMQLDFLMHELQGPEARAMQAIMSTQNAPQAADAILRQFLRPAPEHMERRSARYLGGQGGGVDPAMIAQLSEIAGNPYATDAQRAVVQALIGQAVQGMDPMRALQMERAQLEIEQMRNPQQDPTQAFRALDERARAAGLAPGTPEYQQFMAEGGRRTAQGDNLPANVLELQWRAEQAGLAPGTPEYADFMRLNGVPGNFAALDMQARAAGLTPGSAGYENFMLTRGAGDQAFARGMGANQADIATGGAAGAARSAGAALGTATVNAGVEAFQSVSGVRSSLSNIDEAIAAIDRGAESGVVYNYLPRISEAGASLQNAMNRLGLDVIGSVTFGALSEAEMRLAMEVAVPRNLQAADLKVWLQRRRDAQVKAAEALENAAMFLLTPGNTIDMWIARNRASRAAAAPATPPASADAPPATAAAPAAPEGQAMSPQDFSAMDLRGLMGVDVDSLTGDVLRAYRRRLEEVMNERR
jgi:hypothetical protein